MSITNKKAYFDYDILETLEAGIVLRGAEIKAIRADKASLKGSYAKIMYGDKNKPELFLINANIDVNAGQENTRSRKLLIHKKEISKLLGKTTEKKLTIVPTKLYINNRGLAKVEIALARGKQLHDKRSTIKQRETNIDIRRQLKNY